MNVHLILDAESVERVDGDVTFHLNPATKHPDNPVMLPGLPHEWDSLSVTWPGTVLYSPRDRTFRCWYGALDVVQHPQRCWRFGYAESGDGINWVKPKLGQVSFLDRDTNQLRPDWIRWPANVPVPDWGTYMLSLVFENPLPAAPESRRFGAYWIETHSSDDGQHRHLVKALAWSPDGIRWTRAGVAHDLHPYRRADFHDIAQVLYDPDEPDADYRVKAYAQSYATRAYDGRGGVRHVGFLHGRGFERVEPAADFVALAPAEGIDEEIHFSTVRKIGRTYVMLFESGRFSQTPTHGDLRLAVSADGRRFRRVHPHTPLVATGEKGMWDANLLVTTTSAMQEVGDEIRIYYFGCPRVFNAWPSQYAVDPQRRGSLFCSACLGLATLPRDRFAYASGLGTVTLSPFDLGSEGLWLNADGGAIGVNAIDDRGGVMGTGHLGGERRHTVYRRVIWDGAAPHRSKKIRVTLGPVDRLFSVAC